MPFSMDYHILIYISLIIVLALAAITLKKGVLIVAIPFRMAIAAVLIVVFNISAGKYIHVNIPLNIITAFIAGVLELPGIILIFIIKYAIYVV